MAFIALERRGPTWEIVGGDRSAAFGQTISLPDGERDGVFAGWRWEAGRLVVEADRYGFYPLYACADNGSWMLSTSIDELLARRCPRSLDYDALSVFLRVGFFVEDDTPFRAIRALPPQPRIDTAGECVGVNGSIPVTPEQALTREAAVEAYIDLFRQSMARRPPSGAFHLPLSGGRDSRHILFELAERGTLPSACVTVEHFPPRGNEDVAIAAGLCARLGVRHLVLRQPDDRKRLEAEKNRATHYCSDEHVQFVVLARHLGRESPETFDGVAGDVLSQSSYLNSAALAAFGSGDTVAAARYVLEGFGTMVSERALSRLIAPPFLREVPRDRAVARLARAIGPHMAAANPVKSFFFWNRTRREVALAPYGLMRTVRVHAPYLDRDVFDLLSSLPPAVEMDRRLHTEAIARAYPQHRDVPYESRSVAAAASGRVTAIRLLGALARSRRTLRASTLVPGVAAAVVTGRTDGLWHTALAFYLAQLGEIAASRER